MLTRSRGRFGAGARNRKAHESESRIEMDDEDRENLARTIYIRLREEIDERAQDDMKSAKHDEGESAKDPTLGAEQKAERSGSG